MNNKHINHNKLNMFAVFFAALLYFTFSPAMSSHAQHLTSEALPSKEDAKPSLIFNISMNYALDTKGVSGREFVAAKALENFYIERDKKPLWMTKDGFTPQGLTLFNRIENAWTHGLNPNTYHYERIKYFNERSNFMRRARAELLMTDAFMRYARDLSGIRIKDTRGLQTDASYWRQPMAAETTLSYLQSGQSMETIFAAIEPQSPTYKKLREVLIKVVAEENVSSYDHVLPIEIDYMIRPNERHKKIPDLRVRLGTEPQTKDIYRYDDRLVAAVMKFQRENRLNDDGVIGTNTLRLLNRTRHDKIVQLIANLERYRWAHPERADKYIVVNIPSATLWAIKEQKVALEMPVIVGNPGRKTQSFITHVEGVRFNPDWTVPSTIKRFDIWPKVKKDINYLNDKGIELVKGYGNGRQVLNPQSFNWANMSWYDVRDIRMVQNPGENNPLGRVRVLMPNKYNIYLHDTNHPEYFERTERALSSGCIRMKEPEKIAKFIMESRAGWHNGMMHAALQSGKKTDIEIDAGVKIPVYIYYYTNWVDEQGNVIFSSDVYKNDPRLVSYLKEIDGVFIPGEQKTPSQNTKILEQQADAEDIVLPPSTAG